MDMQEAAFTVTLCDYPGLPEHERNKAEARYARVLERQLGSAEQVSEVLSLVQGLEDTPPEEISDDAKLAFHRWMKAARAATEAGMQGLGDGECSFFEVRRGWRH
ncbi:Uncharacterised protein [Delftia tsuruhatensis]|uniref:hypothetical protein n=1 Tax=Delftia tsuruhatensis TaxID=180282 RepID=UPI001E72F41C|nr:hypothetical protein [Delftia tsuruhatensis]CAB5720364.1 Uncharacterised protein [Delftia tsuruhatensis]CAC9685758.1 Uncharacterised protein [Delftia tsuruhatensis]